MTTSRLLRAAAIGASILAAVGCAAAPAKFRIDGVDVPGSWITSAEKGGDAGDGPTQARACLALARKLWDRNSLEALRYLRRGALLRDPECCRQYLARGEDPSVNQAQRAYVRLFLEKLLRQGPVRGAGGEDIRGELYQHLCLAWRYTEPCSTGKVKQLLESMAGLGWKPEETPSSALGSLIRESGLRAGVGGRPSPVSPDVLLYAGENAEEPRRWLRVPSDREGRPLGDWIVTEANVWGGGSERLLVGTNVLAFLVNGQGEPSFRGSQLWICNLGDTPVLLTSIAAGQCNRELVPGREELYPLASDAAGKGELVDEIPLRIRHPRFVR